MKKIFLLLFTAFLISCCSKDDNYGEGLPAETQTGVGTFACKVNGKPFIDKSGGYFNCYYQFVDGEYYFGIQGRNKNEEMRTVVLSTTAKTITEGETLLLLENVDGNAWGGANLLQVYLEIMHHTPTPNILENSL